MISVAIYSVLPCMYYGEILELGKYSTGGF